MNVQVFDSASKTFMFADFSGRARGLQFGTNEHGFAECSFFVPMSQRLAFAIYDWPGLPWLVLSDPKSGTVYEGRVEDIAIVDGGVNLGALGAWRALSDVPYTALWSATDFNQFRQINEDELVGYSPSKYKMDTNKRLFVSLTKNTIYNSPDAGNLVYEVPYNGSRKIVSVEFDYEFNAASQYQARLVSWNENWSGGALDWSLNGTGTTQTGSVVQAVSSKDRVGFDIIALSTVTYTGETGDVYLKITNLRIKTTTASTMLASDIAAALATYVNGVNADQLSASAAEIEATTTDLKDELYEDEYPADILDRLALLHNYEAGVWEGQRLHFRPKGSVGRRWNVNVTRILELQRSLENVRNSAYTTYREAGGRTLRTAVADDTASQGRRAVIRRGLVNVTTTDQTEAETHRDAFLSDRADFAVRASIEFDRLYDPVSQMSYPIWELRAGDTVTMQNLPVGASVEIDNIRTFLVGRTEASQEQGGRWKIDLEPETPTPTLVTLIARQGEGV